MSTSPPVLSHGAPLATLNLEALLQGGAGPNKPATEPECTAGSKDLLLPQTVVGSSYNNGQQLTNRSGAPDILQMIVDEEIRD